MEYIYVMVKNTGDWEDLVVFLTKEEAIQTSITFPSVRIELFSKNADYYGDCKGGYSPTYKYYRNGKLYEQD